jgi:S1-C subfamily serine protease
MLVAASILGSGVTMMATSELQKKGVISDTYLTNKDNNVSADGLVRTASRPVDLSRDFTDVAENTINCVVSIKSYATPQQNYYQGGFIDPFEFFFGPGFGQGQRPRQQQPQQKSEPQATGMGSGVIISADGYIVTNNHVISGAEKLEVTLNDNRQFNATVVGTDEKTDVALIKINAKDLHAITFGNSDAVKPGQWCVAVGNPFGFNSPVTAGIISAKARGMNTSDNGGIKAFIQHDAAVNPGNSGGALVNTAGELIGINTMIYSQTGNYSGCSFAVPSNTVKKVITDIKQYGTVQRAVLGIQYTELTAEKAKEEKITATNEGIYVAKVTDRGAAKEAGLQ